MDATIITASSHKEKAAPTFKKTFGFHPLAAWCANTMECLAMELRPGNAGSNTASDHRTVLGQALTQIPGSCKAKILVRIDGAGATHALLEHLEELGTARRAPCATPWDGPSPARTRKRWRPCPRPLGRRRCTRTAPPIPNTRSPS